MPQTLGAFLAIMAVMMFSLNYHQSTLHSQRSLISSEMEVMASAIASDVMNYVASKPFDARTADNTVTRYNKNVNQLTLESGFGSCAVFEDCNDIDDFHSIPTFKRVFQIESGVEVAFDVKVSVAYVDDYGARSASPTWVKEVTVAVKAADSGSEQAYLTHPIQLKRQFSPQW